MSNPAISADIGEFTHQLDSLGRALLNGQITAFAWQDGMEKLYGNIDLDTLLRAIDFEHMINNSAFDYIDQDRQFTHVKFLPETGAPENMVVTTKVSKIPKGCSILPHGHLNIVSAVLTLSGEFHVRQYDRLYYDESFFNIRLASDHYSLPGQFHFQSEDKNNIHWLTAMTDNTYVFSTQIINVNPSQQTASLLFVDPNGKDLGNGVIQARRIDFDRAQELYG